MTDRASALFPLDLLSLETVEFSLGLILQRFGYQIAGEMTEQKNFTNL